jgi:hypothetical protein
LNGAQITSLVSLIAEVRNGNLPKESARLIIRTAFPTFDDKLVMKILNPIEEDFADEKERTAASSSSALMGKPAAKRN